MDQNDFDFSADHFSVHFSEKPNRFHTIPNDPYQRQNRAHLRHLSTFFRAMLPDFHKFTNLTQSWRFTLYTQLNTSKLIRHRLT